MDLGRSYHGSVCSFNGSGVVLIMGVFSLNGPRSFLSWECLFFQWIWSRSYHGSVFSMDLGRSYHGSVFSFNGSGVVLIMGVFFQWT